MTKPFANETVPAVRHMTEGELVRFALADDYEILEELGRGGMAIVYRARELALDREVAIKVLPGRLVVDQGFIERFEHEARTAAKLEHPSIVPIYRVGRAGPNADVIYFVMKLLRGQSLSSVLAERGMLEPGEVRRILMETAGALHYAAKQSVVHRDIKPDNIMLDSEGRCVLTDFGIAKAPGGQQTTAGTSLGTPRYMSPEHAMGQQLDGRSDMYSLGIVAYQCLFGKAPFEADEPFAVLYKHIHDPVPEPTLVSDEARQLYPIIARMLAKKPDDRFQTGNDLIAALGGQISDPSLTASTMLSPGLMAPTEVMPTPKPWSRERWQMLSRTRQVVVGLAATTVFAVVLGFTINKGPFGRIDSMAAANGATFPIGKSATPPELKGATVTKMSAEDSAKLAPKPKLPSAKAQAILDANKVASKCPVIDTMPGTKPIAYALLVDSVPDRVWDDHLYIGYDICGLARQTPYSIAFTLSKKGGMLGRGAKEVRQLPVADIARATRHRLRAAFDMKKEGMPPGDYKFEVTLSAVKGKPPITQTREFKILERKQQ
jgi:serine/threonine protein kinase